METVLAHKSFGVSCWSEHTDSLAEVGLSLEVLERLTIAGLVVVSIVVLLARERICWKVVPRRVVRYMAIGREEWRVGAQVDHKTALETQQ